MEIFVICPCLLTYLSFMTCLRFLTIGSLYLSFSCNLVHSYPLPPFIIFYVFRPSPSLLIQHAKLKRSHHQWEFKWVLAVENRCVDVPKLDANNTTPKETFVGSQDDVKPGRNKGEKNIRKPRYAFQTRSHVDTLDDLYRWRKYGRKDVKNKKHPWSVALSILPLLLLLLDVFSLWAWLKLFHATLPPLSHPYLYMST